MTHDQALQFLHGAADGLLSQHDRAALEAHLAECAECRALAAELDSLQLALSHTLHTHWDADALPADLPRKVLNRVQRLNLQQPILRVAGALAGVGVLIALVVIFSGFFGGTSTGPGTQLPDTVPPATTPPASIGGSNGLIAFQSERDGNFEIYVMNADGSDQGNLTRNPAADIAPAWSPDGTRIAFISDRSGQQEIYVMNVEDTLQGTDGLGVTQLTNSPEVTWLPPLSWSPDGARLAAARALSFRENREGIEIYVINADGSGAVAVTGDRFNNFSPQWSPDGQHIAFISLRYTPTVLYSISPDGTGLTPLGGNGARNAGPYDWSPDGRRLVYFSTARTRFGDYSDEIRIVNADGSGEKTIVAFDKPRRSPYSDLAWSPDGTRLIFASSHENTPEGSQHIYLLWADGSGLTRLTGPAANSTQPVWSPDSKWIAFVSSQGASKDIYVMNVENAIRSPEALALIRLTTTGKDSDPQWQPVVALPAEQAALPSPVPTPTLTPAIRILGVHQVKSGETVRCIASAYGVSASAIIELNQLGDPPQLHVGPLLIPDVKDEAGAGGRVCPPQFPSPYSLGPAVTVPAPTTFPFVLMGDAISAISNFTNTAGCDWMGIAGQAFARNGEPLAGLVIHLEGGGLRREALTGSKLEYGPGGYELQLSDHLAATTGVYRLQLRDVHSQPLSDWIPVDTFADCSRNLLVLKFVQK
jgi:TolB protein